MFRAIYQGVVIAESEKTIELEGNWYFPPEDVKKEYLFPSDHRTICPWKGEARYYHVRVGDHIAWNAAWYYPDPKDAARHIRGYIAFWKDVVVERS
ncbi:MAG: DUF427 domain-containing protein [Candidatus Caldatribacterium sp.]|uniref:DUF427 domain-containing protein n=1 Tax=Candidatus Caldatribacterium sp. TaxID=2282143 RepID=UPI00299B1C52|nr:DUF427 domain-containing protein [Candidatus Caldatribacterium sp.]MCX7730628.1 DUF427 domain-containing protein [Candidatus Caldatribacterium sp.]MDW8081129.1 DUF427 domain-containing protein [Candidatus Calescibacterium sp.]